MWRGVGADPTALHEHVASYEYPRALEVAKIGDRPDIDDPGAAQVKTLRR